MNDQNKHETPKMIEMPEHLRLEAHSRDLGGAAVKPLETSGAFNNGVVVVDKGPGTPVENPSPEAIRRAGTETMIDGKVGYVLPGQSVATHDN